MTDNEQAIANSMKSSFPNIRITECRFHFKLAVLKKIKAVVFYQEYIHDTFVRK